MKTYEEITAALLRRREEYEKQKKRQRLLLVRMGVMLSCCALVAVLGLQTLPRGNVPLFPMPDYDEEGNGSNKGPHANNHEPGWGENGRPSGEGNQEEPDISVPDDDVSLIDPDDDFAVAAWHGKDVTGQLLQWLQNAAAEDVLPLVWVKPGINMEYVYRGKTLRQYWEASEEERTLPERLASLYKMGDNLKYGEALYTTGTPTGEKWVEELYREVVTYIGQELLDQYIVDGEFLKDALWDTLQNREFLCVAQGEWNNALEFYREDACSKAKGVLLQQGLEAYHPGNYVGVAKITKAQFEALDAEYFAGWTFGCGEDPNAPQDMTDDENVIGGIVTDDADNNRFTPDSSWSQFETSADDEKIGVGFDDPAQDDKP